jgi:phosphatidylinositol kinase/protein kinase (PI-3  family)
MEMNLGEETDALMISRERAPFVFTPAMAYVLGGSSSPLFKEFELLCCRAYNVLRKHSTLLITLFSLMLQCGIPELETDADIVWLREKLLIGSSDEEAAKYFNARIHEALTTRTVQLNDAVHMLVHA